MLKPHLFSLMLSAAFALVAAPLAGAEEAASGSSVYRIAPWVDGPIIGATALGVALPYALSERLITRRCPCDPGEVNAFDRGAIGNENAFLDGLSDATAGVAIGAPLALDLLDLGASPAFVEDAVVFAEVMSVSGAAVTLAKYTSQRPLPRVYAGQDPELASRPGGYRSFYSGHVSSTVAALSMASMTLHYRYGTGAWPWLVTAGVGASVALERVAAGRHFPTDVILGAAAGSAIGILVPWLHRRQPEVGLSLRPVPSGGLQLAWSRGF